MLLLSSQTDCMESGITQNVMFNLRLIKGLKSLGRNYLGIAAGEFVEVRDNDPQIRNLLPEGTTFTPSVQLPYRGRKRLILLNYSSTCLVMIKSSRTLTGVAQAELY